MIIIREAKISDIDNLMRLEENCFNKYTQESKDVYEERIKYFSQGFLIMEEYGVLYGAVSSEIWNFKENILLKDFSLGHSINDKLDLNGNELYVSSIGIFPEYRSSGLGKKLFNELIVHIKTLYPKVTKSILLINETWANAMKIYCGYGFRYVFEFPDFFTGDDGNKQKGIVMRKSLV